MFHPHFYDISTFHYSKQSQLFVTCAAGLENILAHELGALGFPHTRAIYSGVHVYKLQPNALTPALMRINYASRVATRVLLPLIRFPCRDKTELYSNVYSFPWLSMFTGEKQKTNKKEEGEKKGNKAKKKEKDETVEMDSSELPTMAVSTVMNLTSPGFDRSTFPSQV